MKPILVAVSLILGLATVPATAQALPPLGNRVDNQVATEPTEDSAAAISVAAAEDADTAIAGRLRGIYGQLNGLASAQISVDTGVVTLSGAVAEPADIDRARQIALRVDGVVAVQNDLQRDGNVSQDLAPVMGRLNERLGQIAQMLPLLAIADFIIVLFWPAGSALALKF